MVKFLGAFHTTLEFGHVVIIGGKIRDGAENFTMNLQSEANTSDIPFHMNVVFGENEQIIRNTKINGEFGAAENMVGMFSKQKNPLKSGEFDQNPIARITELIRIFSSDVISRATLCCAIN